MTHLSRLITWSKYPPVKPVALNYGPLKAVKNREPPNFTLKRLRDKQVLIVNRVKTRIGKEVLLPLRPQYSDIVKEQVEAAIALHEAIKQEKEFRAYMVKHGYDRAGLTSHVPPVVLHGTGLDHLDGRLSSLIERTKVCGYIS